MKTNINKDILNLKMSEWVKPICGNKFERAGIKTVGDFIEAIETFGLYEYRKDKGLAYMFDGENSPYVSQAGIKIWAIALSALDAIGFNWRDYIIRRGYFLTSCPTKFETEKQISNSIDKLVELLQQYQQLITNELPNKLLKGVALDSGSDSASVREGEYSIHASHGSGESTSGPC